MIDVEIIDYSDVEFDLRLSYTGSQYYSPATFDHPDEAGGSYEYDWEIVYDVADGFDIVMLEGTYYKEW